ncbi:MAG: DUF87 domain-containing protein [Candidatus Aenigmatarchaeota archaeon]
MQLKLATNLSVDAQGIATGRTCVIAQSGAGKSYLIAVLCEKMLKEGIPFAIIDTEGEYFSLKQKFQLLWVGGEGADLELEKVDLKRLAERVVKENAPVIFDVSDSLDDKQAVAGFCNALYAVETKAKKPYLLIIEEADKFAPQLIDKDGKKAGALEAIEEIARRGRKRGLGLLIASQRPAVVNKNVLSQCGNQFIGKLTTENDLAAVNLFFSGRKELDQLPKLEEGEFFAMGGLSRNRIRFKSFARLTQHEGLTPKLIPQLAGKISKLKSALKGGVVERHTADEGPKNAFYGIPVKVDRNGALDIAEMKGRHFLGKRDSLVGLELVWEPMVYIEEEILGSLFHRSNSTVSFVVDSATGELAEVRNGLRLFSGFDKLLGRTENEARFLLSIEKKGTTLAELEVKTGLSAGALHEIAVRLRSARLLSWSVRKNVNFYFPLRSFRAPFLDRDASWNAEKIVARGELAEQKLDENSLRRLLKAMNSRSEITEFKPFYYPVWHARLQGKNARLVRIDGVTGREI